jgi:hypothetical protein
MLYALAALNVPDLHPEGQKPVIIAVLHERMEMIARLRGRLA